MVQQKQKNNRWANTWGLGKCTSYVAGISRATMLTAQNTAASVPTSVMSAIGIIISRGLVASLQLFCTLVYFLSPPIFMPVVAASAIGTGVYVYKNRKSPHYNSEMPIQKDFPT